MSNGKMNVNEMDRIEVLEKIRKCNITYHKLGESDRSAMPIGNGELCASVWVTQKGRLFLYLSRTDALTEYDRTVKLGMIELDFAPDVFEIDKYSQMLNVADGIIHIKGKGCSLQVFIGCGEDILYVTGRFKERTTIRASYTIWRKKDIVPNGEYVVDMKVKETRDIVQNCSDKILFYHKNGETIIKSTASLQGVGEHMELLPDYLTGRIFGGIMGMKDAFFENETLIKKDANEIELEIVTLSDQMMEPDFISALKKQWKEKRSAISAKEATRDWWNAYWKKSYIFVENDEIRRSEIDNELIKCAKEPMEYGCECTSNVTKAYVLTKYMTTCCSRGNFPILYNGMLFNLCPGDGEHFSKLNFGKVYTSQPKEITEEINPDERSWCVEQLWQNVRHPYYSFLYRGEEEPLRILFRYYQNFWALNRYRAKLYYGAKGQHNTEMTLSFGLYSAGIYGKDRYRLPQGYVENRWGGAVDISPGLELISLMLDYYMYTKEADFLKEEILPYTRELLEYIESRFPYKKEGKMIIGPLNAVETYRDTINPIPTIAGLYSILARILVLDKSLVDEFEYLESYYNQLPHIPVADNLEGMIINPAQVFSENRHNVEIPELYACFPFKLYGIAKPEIELAKHTYFTRTRQYNCRKHFKMGETPGEPSYSGWQYIGVVAAILGITDDAKEILEYNCTLQNPGTRFPAMWGPIYDAVPDTDHGANILNQLQHMVMQVYGDSIYILPAFPKAWNVSFKLYPDKKTTVTCEYKEGKLTYLNITPQFREKDVHICCLDKKEEA